MSAQVEQPIHSLASARGVFKKAVEKIVTPLLGVASLVFWITYFDVSSLYPAIGIAVAIATAIMNIRWTLKPWSLNFFGKSLNMRSDQADLVRWTINLAILDPIIVLFMNPDPVGMLVVWIILMIGAICDMFESRFRAITAGIGIISGMLVFAYAHGQNYALMQMLFFAVCLGAISAALLACFRMWEKALNEIESFHIERQKMERDVFKLRSESMIGQQSRAISHEIKNILSVMTLALDIPNTDGSKRETILRRTVEKLSRISTIVTNTNRTSDVRVKRNVADLLEDVRMIVGPFAAGYKVSLQIDVTEESKSVSFEELDGTLYLILHNLIKNGIEATVDKGTSGSEKIELAVRAAPNQSGLMRFEVRDQGMGMDANQLQTYLSGNLGTSKEYGHGLGGKFIVDRCAQNGFKLGGGSQKNIGTSIWIDVPILSSAS